MIDSVKYLQMLNEGPLEQLIKAELNHRCPDVQERKSSKMIAQYSLKISCLLGASIAFAALAKSYVGGVFFLGTGGVLMSR